MPLRSSAVVEASIPASRQQSATVAKLDVALDYRPHQPLDMAMSLAKRLNAE